MWTLADHETAVRVLIPIATGATIVLAVAGWMAARRIVLELPVDVLVLDEAPPRSRGHAVLRMIVGFALVALGVMLLVLPGPGVLLIALGLLICAPGWRRKIVRSMMRRPRALREINAFRRRHGRPDVRLPPSWGKPA